MKYPIFHPGDEARIGPAAYDRRMNAIPAHGKFLTPEQSAHLTVLPSADRQQLIERIAKQLREHEQFPSSRIGAKKAKRK